MRKLTIAAITTTVLLLMVALRAADLHRSRVEALDAARKRAANLTVIMSAYLSEAFGAGDASLRQLALHGRRIGGPRAPDRDWAPSLASARAGLTTIGAISVLDRHGIVRHSTRPEIVGQSRRGERAFEDVVGAGDDRLIVGTPYPTISEPPQLIIPIGRRLTDAAGRVEGGVFASFVPAAPRTFFRSVDVGAHGSVWVFHPSGVVLFREPSANETLGQSARNSPIFTAAARQGTGTLEAPLVDGGPLLLTAYHTTSTPALITAVSLDRDEVLGDWWHDIVGSAVLFGVVALTLAATLVVLFRQMDEKADAERALAHARQLEAEHLREANERLASALDREQSARREVEAASALKDQFLMTVSHELRTPLTAIIGWSRMLVDGAVSDRRKEVALRTIERNAHAQTRLIDDLLDVSRMMSGKLRLDVRTVDIADVVESAIDTTKPAAEAKGIRMEMSIDRTAGCIAADPERLQQIVWNLLSNAVKFTPRGGRIDVSVVRRGGDVEIAVSDTGVGIAATFLPHVFERFRQEDAGTTRRFGGLGLGLAIVRNLAELHGGSVTANSEGEGHGATFIVRLPAPPLPVAVAPEATASASPAPARLDGLRVLVVDDDRAALDLFAAMLEHAGAGVTCVGSAAEALEALRGTSYDVLISDIEMPDVDGYSLVRDALALAMGRGDRLITVAVTAYSRPEDEARSFAAGFHRHVRKPLDAATLVAAIQSAAAPPERFGVLRQADER